MLRKSILSRPRMEGQVRSGLPVGQSSKAKEAPAGTAQRVVPQAIAARGVAAKRKRFM